MKRTLLLGSVFVLVSFAAQAGDASSNPLASAYDATKNFVVDAYNNVPVPLPVLVCAALLVRPVIQVARHAAGYGTTSIASAEAKVKDGKHELKVHVGGADVKVEAPVKLFNAKKGSAQALLDALLPHVQAGIDNKKSPLIVDRSAVATPVEKRVYLAVSVGDFALRLACSVQEVGMMVAAVIALHAAARSGVISSSNASAPSAS